MIYRGEQLMYSWRGGVRTPLMPPRNFQPWVKLTFKTRNGIGCRFRVAHNIGALKS